MVMMVMAKTCILEQPLVFEVEVEGKGEVAFAQGGLDTLLDHLQLGLQVGRQQLLLHHQAREDVQEVELLLVYIGFEVQCNRAGG